MGEWIFSADAGAMQLDVHVVRRMQWTARALFMRHLMCPNEKHAPKAVSDLVLHYLKLDISCSALRYKSPEMYLDGPPLARASQCVHFLLKGEVLKEVSVTIITSLIPTGMKLEWPGPVWGKWITQCRDEDADLLVPLACNVLRWNPLQFPSDCMMFYSIISRAVISLMIKSCGFDPNCKFTDSKGRELTPLHVAYNGEVVKALIAGGARINDSEYKNNFDASPLYAQMSWCNSDWRGMAEDGVSAIKALLDGGLTFKHRCRNGLNALEMAYQFGFAWYDSVYGNFPALLLHLPIQTVRESLPDVAPETVIRFACSADFSIILDLFLSLGESKGITINSQFKLPDQLPTSEQPIPPVVRGLTTVSVRLTKLLSAKIENRNADALRAWNLRCLSFENSVA